MVGGGDSAAAAVSLLGELAHSTDGARHDGRRASLGAARELWAKRAAAHELDESCACFSATGRVPQNTEGSCGAQGRSIAGNWKMNLNHLEAIALVQKIAFCLPARYYDEGGRHGAARRSPTSAACRRCVDGDKLLMTYGAQDLSPHDSGAFTGDVSGPMLAKLGCAYVIVGHSERRQYHDEDDEVVNKKVRAAIKPACRPILCVGEQLDVRETGGHVEHCTQQLSAGARRAHAEQVNDSW